MQGRLNAGYASHDETVWPEDDEPGHETVSNNQNVPHFLCHVGVQAEASEPGAEPQVAWPANQDEEPEQAHWMMGNTETAGQPEMETEQSENFTPLSPHLRGMISRHLEQSKGLQPPAWAQDHYSGDNRRMFRSLSIAGALVLASGIGLGITALEFQGKDFGIKSVWNSTAAAMWPQSDPQAESDNFIITADKPAIQTATVATEPQVETSSKISSVKLSVGDAHGVAQSPIALPLAADTAQSGRKIALRLTGLPGEAHLSAGNKSQDDAWLLQSDELANLHLTMPAAPSAPMKITVEAIETDTGKLAAPIQEMTVRIDPKAVVIEPTAVPATDSRNYSGNTASIGVASAPKSTAVVQKSTAGPAAQAMRVRGDETLALGDVVGARGFYKKALQMGDVTAAGRIGRTYDPAVYKAVGVQGLKADPKMAERWYKHAITAGDLDARDDLVRLTKGLAQ